MLTHPKALRVLFITELWERYGFYIILSLLLFYLIHFFHLSDQLSYSILGSVSALAYGNSVIGGYIADRLIGHRTAVLLASLLLSIGYGSLGIAYSLNAVFWSLSLITVGTGLLKPNISSMVGFLYQEDDVRRHSGYTIFFVGINIGIILGEGLAGLIQRYFGWQNLFFTASFALLVAFFTFWIGTSFYNIRDNAILKSIQNNFIGFVLIMSLIGVSYYVIGHPQVAGFLFIIMAIICIGVILYEAYKEERIRNRLIALLVLMVVSVFYWALYFQMFFSMNLFIERVVDRHVSRNLTLVSSLYPTIEAISVILFGVFLSWGWCRLESYYAHLNPSVSLKFTLAFFIHTIALSVLYYSTQNIHGNFLVMQSCLIGVYVLIAIGELLLSPIGLAMVVEWVPRRLVGLMMGIFFLTQGIGSKLSGVFATITVIPKTLTHDLFAMKKIYEHGFFIYALFSLGCTIICMSLVPTIKKLTVNKATNECCTDMASPELLS